MENARSNRYYELLAECRALHDKKRGDYGSDEDPWLNVRASVDFGVPGWIGCLIRANDKMRRLMTAASKRKLANESARDALLDLANYALLSLVLYDEEEAAGGGVPHAETDTSRSDLAGLARYTQQGNVWDGSGPHPDS